MIKCQQCRDKDVELLTHWERIRNWLFEKVNHTFFADDFDDLKSQKYTQGFSDGMTKGVESERNRMEKEQLRYNVQPIQPTEDQINKRLNDLLSNADLTSIVTIDKQRGFIYIGGERADEGRLNNLKQEAEALTSFELWKLIQETPKELAQRSMFVEGENVAKQLEKGRTILYTLSTQKNIVDILKGVKQK